MHIRPVENRDLPSVLAIHNDAVLKTTAIWSGQLDIVVAAIRRAGGEMIFNPSGDTQIREGDLLIGIGRAESLAELGALARGQQK